MTSRTQLTHPRKSWVSQMNLQSTPFVKKFFFSIYININVSASTFINLALCYKKATSGQAQLCPQFYLYYFWVWKISFNLPSFLSFTRFALKSLFTYKQKSWVCNHWGMSTLYLHPTTHKNTHFPVQAFQKVSTELNLWAYTASIFQIICCSLSCL